MRKPKISKRCIICNSEFETRDERRITCKTKCSIERARNKQRLLLKTNVYKIKKAKYIKDNPEKIKESNRKSNLKKSILREKIRKEKY